MFLADVKELHSCLLHLIGQLQPPRSRQHRAALSPQRSHAAVTTNRKKRATPVPLLWAELLGGIIESRQVFTIWFPILSFFLPVKSVSKYPELYNNSFFSVLTFLSTNRKKVSLPVKLNILLTDFQCAVKPNGFA